MSQVTIRAKLGTVTAIQLGLAHAILVAAEEVFAAKPELKATKVITDENEIVVVSKVKAGHTVEFTGREFKQANVARVSAPRQFACGNPLNEYDRVITDDAQLDAEAAYDRVISDDAQLDAEAQVDAQLDAEAAYDAE